MQGKFWHFCYILTAFLDYSSGQNFFSSKRGSFDMTPSASSNEGGSSDPLCFSKKVQELTIDFNDFSVLSKTVDNDEEFIRNEQVCFT